MVERHIKKSVFYGRGREKSTLRTILDFFFSLSGTKKNFISISRHFWVDWRTFLFITIVGISISKTDFQLSTRLLLCHDDSTEVLLTAPSDWISQAKNNTLFKAQIKFAF